MKRMFLALEVLTVGMLFVSSCNEPSPLGSELIEGDQVNIIYTDTIGFNTTTVTEDSVLVFDPNPAIQYINFFIGDYDDPVMGNTKAELNAQLWPNVNPPDFSGAVLDSVVLLLRYDSTNTYGDLITDPFRLGVYELMENLDLDRQYYSNEFFDYEMVTPLGETEDFLPKISAADTLRVLDYTFPPNIDTVTQSAHLRIRLSDDFGNSLINLPSETYESNAAFLEQFNGIVVKALNPTKGILSFNLTSSLSNMTVYYHTDTIYQQYKFIFSPNGGVYFSNFRHDYSNSIVDSFLGNKLKGDSLVFMQSMSGPNIKIEIPDADKLGDILVNKAEFKFTFAELDQDDIAVYTPLDVSIMGIENDLDAGFVFINDVVVGSPAGINWFGGEVEETMDNGGNPLYTYSYNISSHFQRMVEGSEENVIFIRSFPKQSRSKRSVLFGPKNSKYPVTFEVTYTKLDP